MAAYGSVAPIVSLVIVTLAMMVWTGYRIGGSTSIWTIFENTDVPLSLMTGGIVGAVLAAILYISQMGKNDTASFGLLGKGFITGAKIDDAGNSYFDLCMGFISFNWRVGNRAILVRSRREGKYTCQLPSGYSVYPCWVDGIFDRNFLGLFRNPTPDCWNNHDQCRARAASSIIISCFGRCRIRGSRFTNFRYIHSFFDWSRLQPYGPRFHATSLRLDIRGHCSNRLFCPRVYRFGLDRTRCSNCAYCMSVHCMDFKTY